MSGIYMAGLHGVCEVGGGVAILSLPQAVVGVVILHAVCIPVVGVRQALGGGCIQCVCESIQDELILIEV